MRKGLTVVVAMIAVLLLGGCSAKSASEPSLAPSEVGVVGTAGETSQSAPATATTTTRSPNPAVSEGIPSSAGIQVVATEGPTTVTQARAMQIAMARKPAGAKSVAGSHVLYAKSGAKTPIDAWMITFHSAQLPGAGGGSSTKTGSITIIVDSQSGAILDEVAYEPVGK